MTTKGKKKATAEPVDPDSPAGRKALFIRALAEYLVGDQAKRSILLQMQDPEAVLWAKMRGLTPLFGWPTVDEAEKALTEFLR